jgi:hypothetical protein
MKTSPSRSTLLLVTVTPLGSSIAPKTMLGIRFRKLVVRLMRRLPFVLDFFIGRELRDRLQLPDWT